MQTVAIMLNLWYDCCVIIKYITKMLNLLSGRNDEKEKSIWIVRYK